MNKLLIQESPLTFQPSLAVAIGINEAIVLQQVHYWISNPRNKGYEQAGFKWVYNTYAEWKETNFPFWSENTIQRTFSNLEDAGLIVSIQPMKFKYDRTKYYRIDYTKLDVFDDPKLVCSLNESETTTETTTNGDKSPDTSNLPIEWQIAAGAEQVTLPDQTDARRWDIAQLIGMGEKSAAIELAHAFMKARDILIPESKIKGQRKAVREMIEMGVQPEHVTEAVRQLLAKNMTVIDLFSVSKTAQDLANKKEVYTGDKKQHAL